MDLKALIKEAHENAVEKGWYNPPPTMEETICNIHSELSEAWEEYRNNRGLKEIYWKCHYVPIGVCDHGGDCNVCQETECGYAKPCGIPIELADVVIRICDILAVITTIEIIENAILFSIIKPANFALLITSCHKLLTSALDFEDGRVDFLMGVIIIIETYCQDNQIGLEKAIALKMAWNKTSPAGHGNKRV